MKGPCLCGGVKFVIKVPKDEILYYCHCTQCRKNYGMHSASFGGPRESFKITKGRQRVTWYESSKNIFRGFYNTCGSPIAWDNKSLPLMYVLAGLIDGKTKSKKRVHIYTKFKGDYYKICDGYPQYKTMPV